MTPCAAFAFDANLGSTGGVETVGLSEAQLARHAHNGRLYATVAQSGVTIPAWNVYVDSLGGAGGTIKTNSASQIGQTFESAATVNTGSGSAHANMPPWLALECIIKT